MAVIVTATLGASSNARAADSVTSLGSGFDLDRLFPAPAGDRFTFIPETRIRDESCTAHPCWFALSLFGTYASGAVTFKRLDGSGTTTASRVGRLHIGASWAPQEYWQWSLDVPLSVGQSDLSQFDDGYAAPAKSRVGKTPDLLDVGDLRVGLRWQMYRRPRGISLAAQTYAFLPTGDHERLTGDRNFRFDGLAVLESGSHEDSAVVGAVYVGAGARPYDPRFTESTLHLEGKVGGGLSFYVFSLLQATVEARAEHSVVKGAPWPADASGGLRFQPPEKPWWVTLVATKGLSNAPGVPLGAVGISFSIIPPID